MLVADGMPWIWEHVLPELPVDTVPILDFHHAAEHLADSSKARFGSGTRAAMGWYKQARTTLLGWRRYKNHPDRRIRRRFAWEVKYLAVTYAGALWAARRWYRADAAQFEKISQVLNDLHREFGLKSRLAAPIIGRFLYSRIKREDRRLRSGWTYEPPTFRETNKIAAAATAG